MYIIAVYDVNEEYCNKVMKIFRKYLFHKQNSVFEGELTEKEFNNLKKELMNITISNDILFYVLPSAKALKKESLIQRIDDSMII